MEVCRLEVLLQYMKRDINKLILYYMYYCLILLKQTLRNSYVASRSKHYHHDHLSHTIKNSKKCSGRLINKETANFCIGHGTNSHDQWYQVT